MKKLNRYIPAFMAFSGFFAYIPYSLALWFHTGQVRYVQSTDSQQAIPGFSAIARIKGFNKGSCLMDEDETILAIRNDAAGDRQFSTLLSSLIAGRTVMIGIDDTIKTSTGHCILRWVRAQ